MLLEKYLKYLKYLKYSKYSKYSKYWNLENTMYNKLLPKAAPRLNIFVKKY